MDSNTKPVDVLAVMDAEIAEVQKKYRAAINSPRIVPIAHRLQALLDTRAAVAELIEQQKRDAQLVAVLLSYLNDSLSVHDKSRLVTELANRGLADHGDKRRAALARVQGGA